MSLIFCNCSSFELVTGFNNFNSISVNQFIKSSILNSDLLSRVIGIAVNNITNSLTIMASTSYNNHQLKNYQDDIELLDIEIKLKLVDNWLREINVDTINPESNLDIIYRAISDSCHSISWLTKEINNKINHYNSLWFRNWRTIDLDLDVV